MNATLQSRWIVLFVCIFAAAALPAWAASAPQEAAQTHAGKLDAQLDVWTRGLADQPGFERFPEASRDVTPLGPGTHGWLVTLTDGGKTIGYMIVSATPDGGFVLSEYGLGERHPYADDTLRQGLARLGLIPNANANANKPFRSERLYLHPFYAAWRIETDGGVHYVDAATGEELPADDAAWEAASEALAQRADRPAVNPAPAPRRALRTAAAEPFDPYGRMPWLTRQPLPWGTGLLEAKLDGGAELRVTAETFEGAHLVVLPVVAYQAWDDGLGYIGVDPRVDPDDGRQVTRFVPYAAVKPLAALYD